MQSIVFFFNCEFPVEQARHLQYILASLDFCSFWVGSSDYFYYKNHLQDILLQTQFLFYENSFSDKFIRTWKYSACHFTAWMKSFLWIGRSSISLTQYSIFSDDQRITGIKANWSFGNKGELNESFDNIKMPFHLKGMLSSDLMNDNMIIWDLALSSRATLHWKPSTKQQGRKRRENSSCEIHLMSPISKPFYLLTPWARQLNGNAAQLPPLPMSSIAFSVNAL